MTEQHSTQHRMIIITVPGVPAPQGSKTRFPGKAIIGPDGQPTIKGGGMRESSKKVKPWRQLVDAHARQAMARAGRGPDALNPSRVWRAGEEGPVSMFVLFLFARPAYHFGTGRNAAVLKPDAPTWHTKYPDESKLLRSTEDALVTAGVLKDDSVIARHSMAKRYANAGETPGATIVLSTNMLTVMDKL